MKMKEINKDHKSGNNSSQLELLEFSNANKIFYRLDLKLK
jgi:hypothetical protein